ncbi:MAG: TlpA disulfide reductase family protein, partial [Bacteroidota bacterium]
EPTDLEDKFIVLEFWTTWCGPCIAAVPHLNKLQEEFAGPDVAFVALSDEKPERIQATLKRVPFQAAVGTDQTQASQIAFGDGKRGLDGLPKTVLIDADNVVRWIGTPKELNGETMRAFLAGEDVPALDRNWEDVLEADDEEGELDGGYNFDYFLDIFKTSTQMYYVELEPLTGKVREEGSIEMGKLGGHFAPITLPELYAEFFPTVPVEVPPAIANQAFSLLFLNKDDDPDFLDRFEADLLRQLSLTKTTEVRQDTVYTVRLVDAAQLDEVKDEQFSSISDDDDQVVITNYALPAVFEELNKFRDEEWRFAGKDDGKRYAFIIQLDDPAAIEKSLAAYGLEVEASLVEREVTVLR